MSDVKWAPDGKKMFEKLLSAVPDAMKDMARPQLLKFLAAQVSRPSISITHTTNEKRFMIVPSVSARTTPSQSKPISRQ